MGASQFPVGDGGNVVVGAAGALDGDGTVGDPLVVNVDGTTIAINGSNQLAVVAGGIVGGSDTQVQFNDGGVLAGDAGLTYAKTTDLLTVTGGVNFAAAGVKASGANGILTLLGLGTGADETLVIDLDTTANVIGLSSTTAATLVWSQASIGVTTAAGLTLTNPTAAAAGAQQYSPRFSQIGQGWSTNSSGASMPVEIGWEVRPVQGAAAPTFNYALMGRINGGAWSDLHVTNSTGNVAFGATTFPERVNIGPNSNTASTRHTLTFANGGFAAPATFDTNSNGDKIILYRNGTDYDATIGIGTTANLWFKSITNAAGGGIEFYAGSSTTRRVLIDPNGMTIAGTIYGGNGGTPTMGGAYTIVTGAKDLAGRATTATTGVSTGTVTFSQTFASAPSCWANNETTANIQKASATTTVLTIIGTTVAGDTISYGCKAIL